MNAEKDSMIPIYLMPPFFVLTYTIYLSFAPPPLSSSSPSPPPFILSPSLSSPQPAQGRPTLPARNTSSPLGFAVGATPGVQHCLSVYAS